MAIRARVHTGEVLAVTQAALKHVRRIRRGGVVLAPDPIVDVVTVPGRVRTCRVARLQAERVPAHEVVPLDGLDVRVRIPG